MSVWVVIKNALRGGTGFPRRPLVALVALAAAALAAGCGGGGNNNSNSGGGGGAYGGGGAPSTSSGPASAWPADKSSGTPKASSNVKYHFHHI